MLLVACAAVVILVGTALAGSPALAARGGKLGGGGHKGGGPGSGVVATLAYAPSPVPVGNTFTVTGTGFAPNSWVGVGFYGWITWDYTMSDASGNISYTYPTMMDYCDSYLFEALQGSKTATVYVDVVGCP